MVSELRLILGKTLDIYAVVPNNSPLLYLYPLSCDFAHRQTRDSLLLPMIIKSGHVICFHKWNSCRHDTSKNLKLIVQLN